LILLTSFENLPTDEEINRVGFVGPFDALFKWERKDAGVVTKPPEVCFGSCKTSAMDTTLLTCADAY
jgi:hypothetical protein